MPKLSIISITLVSLLLLSSPVFAEEEQLDTTGTKTATSNAAEAVEEKADTPTESLPEGQLGYTNYCGQNCYQCSTDNYRGNRICSKCWKSTFLHIGTRFQSCRKDSVGAIAGCKVHKAVHRVVRCEECDLGDGWYTDYRLGCVQCKEAASTKILKNGVCVARETALINCAIGQKDKDECYTCKKGSSFSATRRMSARNQLMLQSAWNTHPTSMVAPNATKASPR